MAQKPVREIQAKNLVLQCYEGEGAPVVQFVEIGPDTDLKALPKEHPWLAKGKLVAKPDELFGKRGKLGYVHIAKDWKDAEKWISTKRGEKTTIAERKGALDHFLIEPFIEHKTEYYLAITAEREHDVILFSEKGGMEVEEQGDALQKIYTELDKEPDVSSLPKEVQQTVLGLFQLCRKRDVSFLEINPLVCTGKKIYLLDAVMRVDTSAAYRQKDSWGSEEIPEGFGTTLTKEEKMIRTMDSKSGSSLKFVLLNPKGHVWTMVAGGGASIIYADAIINQTDAAELANYGEWSGNPSTDEMEAYTNEILTLMTKNKDKQALIIGGGIANFTDIAKTFAGVIKALKKHQKKLKDLVTIYVRRAGPNDRIGLERLQEACDEMGITCFTHGAELPMTEVIGTALSDLSLKQ